jgi:hypothetical protein
VRSEYVDVAEGRVTDTDSGVPIVQELGDVLPAVAHHRKPLARDGAKRWLARIKPPVDLRLVLCRAIEPKKAAHECSVEILANAPGASSFTRSLNGLGSS